MGIRDRLASLEELAGKTIKTEWFDPDTLLKYSQILCFLIDAGCILEEEAEAFLVESEAKRTARREGAKEARLRRYLQLKAEFEPEGTNGN